jgi:hypothetical protein
MPHSWITTGATYPIALHVKSVHARQRTHSTTTIN